MNIISAKAACYNTKAISKNKTVEAKKSKEYTDKVYEVQEAISNAIENGEYYCTIVRAFNRTIMDCIEEDLRELGYKISYSTIGMHISWNHLYNEVN